MMLQRPNLLTLFIFITWACRIINGVVSDPQTNLLKIGCSAPNQFFVSNYSIFNDNLNLTLQEIRDQISDDPNKRFATAREGSGGNPISTLFQCRNYLSVADCVMCLDIAAAQIRNCSTGSYGGHVVYDGCFLRYEAGDFYGETTGSLTKTLCGDQNAREAISFTASIQKVLMNLQTAIPTIPGFSAATKIQVPNNGSSSNKATIIGGVVGVLALVLILLALFAWIRRPKSPKRVPS